MGNSEKVGICELGFGGKVEKLNSLMEYRQLKKKKKKRFYGIRTYDRDEEGACKC